jgi:hypothetical protein
LKESLNQEIFLNETSEEEEVEEVDLDDEYDEEKKAATSVLQTAEQLSAQVLRSMTCWGNANKDGSAPQGMIVDGALSLSSLANNQTADTNTWISKEKMSEICPNVTLSDYQVSIVKIAAYELRIDTAHTVDSAFSWLG